jgi:hypothetical protein
MRTELRTDGMSMPDRLEAHTERVRVGVQGVNQPPLSVGAGERNLRRQTAHGCMQEGAGGRIQGPGTGTRGAPVAAPV